MHMWINNMTLESNKYSTEIRKGGCVLPFDVAWSGRLSWVRRVGAAGWGSGKGGLGPDLWQEPSGRGGVPLERKWGVQREITVCSVLKGQGLVLIPAWWEASEGEGDAIQCVLNRRLLCLRDARGEESEEWGDDQMAGSGTSTSLAPRCRY